MTSDASPVPEAPKFPSLLHRLRRIIFPFFYPAGDASPVSRTPGFGDTLETLLQERMDDGRYISEEEQLILRKMLRLGEHTVSDIMVPRTDIIALDDQITLTELKRVIAEEQHSRMPVYQGTLDKLIGFVHLKDLVPALAGDEPFDIEKMLRDIYFISPSMQLIDLLVHMRASGHHLAIVVDEYGGTDGLVTLEDIFEALVGEIQDEHDIGEEETLLRRIASHQFEMDARMRIDDLQEETGIDFHAVLADEDFDTIGGFIFARLHRVPVTGEIIDIPDIGRIKIMDADPRRIRKVHLALNFTPLRSS